MKCKLAKEFSYVRKNWHSPYRRPIWQILLLLPLALVYLPAAAFVRWMDRL